MSERNITIFTGGMFQEWSCLMELLEEETAKVLEQLANTRGGEKYRSKKQKRWALAGLQNGLYLKLIR